MCCDRFRFLATVVLGLGLQLSAPGSAIQRADGPAGEYLITPFVLANGTYETLIEISDSTEDPAARALKLRVLDRDGEPRLTANLYLPRNATWSAGLTRQGDMARLITGPEACLLVDGPNKIEVVYQADIELTAGSLEVVEMGTAVDPPLASHIADGDCNAIVELWANDSWLANAALSPPAGGIRSSVRVINVANGTIYGVPTTALRAFSNIVQHQPPGSAQPDLASTHDEGTAAGETRSVTCFDDGCIEDYWNRPIDAASAALMRYTVSDTFDISESLGARSEWVVTLPTMNLYSADHPLSSASASTLIAERSGVTWNGPVIPTPPSLPFFNDTTFWLEYGESVNPLDFTTTVPEVGAVQETRLFGLGHVVQSPGESLSEKSPFPTDHLPNNGQARLGFDCGDGDPALVASSGRSYWGCPAIVTTFTEYTNGQLQGDDGVLQRANYGAFGSPTTTVRIDPPTE